MWHYLRQGDRMGPVDEEALDELVARREVDRATLVWREGMESWLQLGQTELGERLDLPVLARPSAVARTEHGVPAGDLVTQARKLQRWFTTWWVCMLAGIPLAFVLVGFGVIAAGVVFQFMLLHGLWKVVQDGKARTTPGKAIGFLFIPFFQIYWMFVAFHGLAQELNRVIDAEGLPVAKASEGLALSYCIVMCCGVIPVVQFAAAVALPILLILNLKQLKDAGVGILQARAA
jgi:hypothetical protein